jgi:hypothetical protein
MKAFDEKTYDFAKTKCQYERDIETCILEYHYFGSKSRAILSETKFGFEKCQLEHTKAPKEVESCK